MPEPWFEIASEIVRSPEIARKRIEARLGRAFTRQQMCSLRAIARLHPLVGETLDKMGADWNDARYVGHGPGPAAQRARALQKLTELQDKRKGKRWSKLGLDLLADLQEAPGLERLLAKTRPSITTAKELRK